jgi:hypothetical protein
MLIMALDVATKLGYAIGRAGEKPRAGSERLKRPDDPSQRACKKLGIWLRDQFAFELPDLVVIEAPVNIGGMIDWKKDSGERPTFRSTPETISLLHRLVGGVETICGPYGIRCESANVQSVRKHVVGKARPENPKQAVLARCQMLGYLPKDSRDTDAADAVALHIYASDVICRAKPAGLVLFGGN